MAAPCKEIMESGGFQVVSRKGRRKHKTYGKPNCAEHKEDSDVVDMPAMKERILLTRSELQQSDFYLKLLEQTKDASHSFPAISSMESEGLSSQEWSTGSDVEKNDREMTGSPTESPGTQGKMASGCQQGYQEALCYGLGRFSQCPIARYQLALLLALREDLQIPFEKTFVYDPLFSVQEVAILKDFYLQVISENEEGKRRCGSRCLVFMPHCGKALFNNLLWANWGSNLAQMVILGNSFSSCVERIPGRVLNQTGNLILSIQPYVKEVVIDNRFHHTDIFNDMSLHWFPPCSLAQAEPGFWSPGKPPQYEEDDPDIITKKDVHVDGQIT